MPEWFKGSDSSSDSVSFVGSNPTLCKYYINLYINLLIYKYNSMTFSLDFQMAFFRFVGIYIIVSVFLFIHHPIITGITITIFLTISNFFSHDIHYNTIIDTVRLFTNKIKLTDYILYISIELFGGYLAVKTYKYFNHK